MPTESRSRTRRRNALDVQLHPWDHPGMEATTSRMLSRRVPGAIRIICCVLATALVMAPGCCPAQYDPDEIYAHQVVLAPLVPVTAVFEIAFFPGFYLLLLVGQPGNLSNPDLHPGRVFLALTRSLIAAMSCHERILDDQDAFFPDLPGTPPITKKPPTRGER